MPELRSIFIHLLIHLFNKYSLAVSCLSDTVISSNDTMTYTFGMHGEVRAKML